MDTDGVFIFILKILLLIQPPPHIKSEDGVSESVLPYRVGRSDRSVAVELLVDNREPNQTREVSELGGKCRSALWR